MHWNLRTIKRLDSKEPQPVSNIILTSSSQRIVFLDYLRAFACLLVVFGHIFLVGANDPNTVRYWVPTVKSYIFGINSNNIYAHVVDSVTVRTGLGVGQLGVGIFFLVSGFIIPRAIDHMSWKTFLIRRLFRIYPLLILAVSCVAAITTVFCYHYGVHDPNSWRGILSSMFLANFYTHDFAAIPVTWTLEVEMAFYLVITALSAMVRRIDRNVILSTGLTCLALTVTSIVCTKSFSFTSSTLALILHISTLARHLTFLLIGSMIYRSLGKGRTFSSLCYLTISISIYYIESYCNGFLVNWANLGLDDVNATTSLAIFLLVLAMKMEWRWLQPVRWIGEISYPLYLIHVPIGWFVLSALAGYGWNIHAAGAVTLLVVVLLAWTLHIAIENPSQRFGKRFAKWLLSPHKLFAAR